MTRGLAPRAARRARPRRSRRAVARRARRRRAGRLGAARPTLADARDAPLPRSPVQEGAAMSASPRPSGSRACATAYRRSATRRDALRAGARRAGARAWPRIDLAPRRGRGAARAAASPGLAITGLIALLVLGGLRRLDRGRAPAPALAASATRPTRRDSRGRAAAIRARRGPPSRARAPRSRRARASAARAARPSRAGAAVECAGHGCGALRGDRPHRAHHARPPRARATGSRRSSCASCCRASSAPTSTRRCTCSLLAGQRPGVLRRLRPRRERRGHGRPSAARRARSDRRGGAPPARRSTPR